MRVIAGSLGGRLFDSPHTSRTHPMSDRVRGALFNTLGDIEGLTVLDPFAGTGALSIEAVSRGATSAVALEIDKSAQDTIAGNISKLGLKSNITLVRLATSVWLQSYSGPLFDLILLDPPYDDLQPDLVQRLVEQLAADGVLVLSWPSSEEPLVFENLGQIEQRQYGTVQLLYYRAIA